MYLIILDSLGSIELLFIAIMALVFFGPRKLPQLSRTLGKNIAEFRRASEDFKRTWEREVALEEFKQDPDNQSLTSYDDNSILSSDEHTDYNEATPESAPESDLEAQPETTAVEPHVSTEAIGTTDTTTQSEPLSKQNWL
ncbi:MAG TPA: twin-arginine translocase TatA/TatE family subunit [Pyrinomonadaceae bacterium]|nr:twin-arginine translocase TatA/TatE family subunit [Pyrinomonadaceae bacterium]